MGKVIKKLREERNMSQKKLAELTEIFNQSQISKIERENRQLKDDEVEMFAKIFKISIKNLYKCSEKMKKIRSDF